MEYMRIRSPSLPELHAFAAVVEYRSFSAAAQALSVTQGAVSRSVARLEDRLGVMLFARSHLTVEPTAAGTAYFAQIRPALDMLEKAVPAPMPAAGSALRLAAVSALSTRWLVPRLPQLCAEHPDFKIDFRRWRHDDGFERDDVDCWLSPRPHAHCRWPSHVVAQHVVGRELVAVCHPSRAARLKRPEDLLRHPLLHHNGHPGDWALWMKGQGFEGSLPALDAGFDLAPALIEAVSADMGVAVVHLCLLERELAAGWLVVPFKRWVSSGRGYCLCRRADREESPQAALFRRWVVAQGRRWQRQALSGY
jgi:LysR family transcriptional regulator, glycine cleavage system transcriptional activator